MKLRPSISEPMPTWLRVVGAVGVAALFALLTQITVHGGAALNAFVWRDVLWVYLLAAVPVSWVLVSSSERLPFRLAMMVLMLAGIAAFFLDSVRTGLGESWLSGFALRFMGSLGIMLVAVQGVQWMFGMSRSEESKRQLALGCVALVAHLLLPALYVEARCRHDLGKLDELLEQQRIGEARELANRMVNLDSSLAWRDKPMPAVVSALDLAVRELETRVSQPVPANASMGVRLERARELAMLNRTGNALDALDSVKSPEANNLRGVIHEARHEWDAGVSAYELAKPEWQALPKSPAQSAGLAQALKGIGYCEQRAGRYPQAEKAYLELLDHAPSADTHFLLAEFYADAQNAQQAQFHARRAITLAPARYREPGERLLRKLSVYQFGCLRVF